MVMCSHDVRSVTFSWVENHVDFERPLFAYNTVYEPYLMSTCISSGIETCLKHHPRPLVLHFVQVNMHSPNSLPVGPLYSSHWLIVVLCLLCLHPPVFDDCWSVELISSKQDARHYTSRLALLLAMPIVASLLSAATLSCVAFVHRCLVYSVFLFSWDYARGSYYVLHYCWVHGI